jgi:AraC-like DNA-binding protein
MDYENHVAPFVAEVDWMDMTRQLSEILPDEAFFVKNLDGRFMMQNRRAVETCRVTREEDTLGKRDADFWSEDRVRMYVEGDRQVIESGEPIINEIAPAPEEAGSDNMILYSKFPVRNRDGGIIGVAGIHRLIDEKSASSTALGTLYRAVQRIHQEFFEELSVRDLARLAALSQSQFERRFKKVLGVSPKEYLIRVRIRAACRRLEQTNWTIARVASECGFYDHSHFSHAFRRAMGVSPSAYRENHGRRI